jgi:fructoselysine-6-P-deglycase FrlB-like protein/sugar/nucleoside kinase (ribokinase family)
MSAPTPRVIVVGNVTLEDVIRPDGTTNMAAVGGNSIYAVLGARLWSERVGVVTRLGEDVAEATRRALATSGVADGTTSTSGPASRYWVLYELDGTRRYVGRTPAERYLELLPRPEDLPRAWLTAEPAPLLHVAAMPLAAAEEIVAAVRAMAPAVRITLDTHEDWSHDMRARALALAGRVDCFVPSREELAQLLGYDDPERAVGDLAGRQDAPPTLVVKLGADGALIWQRDQPDAVRVQAPAPDALVDVTGAGDAFCGGLGAGLAAGLDAVQAARRGAVAASLAIEGFGSLRLASVAPEEAATRLARFPDSSSRVTLDRARPADRRAIRAMLGEIDGIPSLLERQLRELNAPVGELARTMDVIDEVVLVGCGDSYFAGQAATLAFEQCAGVRATALHAMEFSRYRVRYLTERTLVVPISYSGRVGRTVEAATQVKRFGQQICALTGNPDGPLGQACDRAVVLDVPSLGFSPGTNTFAGMLLALLQLAAALGERRKSGTALAEALERLPGAARQTLAVAAEPARGVAARLATAEWLCFIGAGPSEAIARFAAAKLFEGPQMLGTWTNLEEWAHEEYFVSVPGTPVVVVAPSGASRDRAEEILSELKFIGADAVVVSDVEGAALPFAAGLPEPLSPVLAALPLALLAFFLADARGKRSYNFPDAETEREHYDTIHRATIGEPA